MELPKTSGRQLFGRWIRATLAGWLLGIPLIIILALIGEAVGIGGAQVLVGVGMGAGIGFMQGRVIKRALKAPTYWFWSCLVGVGTPFLAVDIARLAGKQFPYSLQASIALGGFIAGVWQQFILRPHSCNSGWWILASAFGWTLAAGTAAVADWQPLRGLWGAVAYLTIVASGGLILGLITGAALVWMLRGNSAV